jgi:mannitol 2-dehydrogenase
MVDRITPATTPQDIAFVAEHFGLDDAWPVMTEPFRQWVMEDTFSNGRPEWERVGAQLIGDVAPYETMKIRLLNGSHLAIAYLGALRGFTYVHEIMADPLFRTFIQAFMDQVTPIVPVIPGTSIPEYKQTLLERFSNPTINDQVTRICSEGSAKMPKWLLPSILDLLERGRPTGLLNLVVGSWIFYFSQGVDERGQPLQIVDARAAELIALASKSRFDSLPMLSERTIFGERLPANASFVQAVEDVLSMLAHKGVEATMRHYLEQKG